MGPAVSIIIGGLITIADCAVRGKDNSTKTRLSSKIIWNGPGGSRESLLDKPGRFLDVILTQVLHFADVAEPFADKHWNNLLLSWIPKRILGFSHHFYKLPEEAWPAVM